MGAMRPPSTAAGTVSRPNGAADGAHHAAERVLEHRRAIRRLAPLFQVRKVEGHHRDPAIRQPFGIPGHEWMKLAGAGAVREYQQGVEVAVFRGGVKRGGNGCFRISWKLEGDGTHNRFLYHCHSDELDSRTMVTTPGSR